MRIGTDQRVEVGDALEFEDNLAEMLQVDLVADAHARGYDAELLEGALGPFQEGVALDVAFVFDHDVLVEARRGAGALQDDRVVDDEFDRHQRVDPLRLAAERHDGVTHRRQVHDRRDARQVLHQHPCGGEGDLSRLVAGRFAVFGGSLRPASECFDVLAGDLDAVFVAQEVL